MKRKAVSLLLSLVMACSAMLPNAITARAEEGDGVTIQASKETRIYVNHFTQTGVSNNIDANWKFHLGDASGAQAAVYDDASWQEVNLPHDYSLIQDYASNMEGESGYKPGGIGWYRKSFTLSSELYGSRIVLQFDGAYQEAEIYVNGTQAAFHPYGYTMFKVDITDLVSFTDNNIIAVKTNNQIPSSRWYSGSGLYRSVYLNIMPAAHIADEGVFFTTPDLAANGGSATNAQIQTTVENDDTEALTLSVQQHLFVRDAATGEAGAAVAQSAMSESISLQSGEAHTFSSQMQVSNPALWSPENPALYILRTELYKDGEVLHTLEQEVGFRYYAFDPNTGFSLNGRNVKLNGVCMHHDQGGLGAASYYDAVERQMRIMKEMGVNSVRVTHNPASRELKDIANRMGILLVEEAFDTWRYHKNGNSNDFATWFDRQIGGGNERLIHAGSEQTWAEFELKQMVLAGRNDPSIIMWSLGNEVMEGFLNAGVSKYGALIAQLGVWADEVDGTRPVTSGDNKLKKNNGNSVKMASALANRKGLKGIVGYNYASGSQYDSAHSKHPDWMIYGSEVASAVNSRGVYEPNNYNTQLTAYDQKTVNWGSFAAEALYTTMTRDFVAGEYVWTGFDYLGEPTPWNGTGSGPARGWPSPKSSYFGIVDTAGFPKDSFYLYQSVWNQNVKVLHVLPAWKKSMLPGGGNNVEVVVYANAPSVELFFRDLNGNTKSLGKRTMKRTVTPAGHVYYYCVGEGASGTDYKNLYLTWNVPYADGTIYAVAYDDNGNVITNTSGESSRSTFGEAARLKLTADTSAVRADAHALKYIEIDVLDAAGNPVADASHAVTVSVSGPARLAAMDNGSPMDHQSYQENNRKAFNGKVLAVVQMTGQPGTVTVTAGSARLTTESVSFNVIAEEIAAEDVRIESFLASQIYYIKQGTQFTLPGTVLARYTDGTEGTVAVSYDFTAEADAALARGETVYVRAHLAEGDVSYMIKIVVIDEIAAMENYATVVERGTVPVLPLTAYAYEPDGTLVEGAFPVTWNMPEDSAFYNNGIVVVEGTGRVLDMVRPVTATVRVTDKLAVIGENVATSAAEATQSLPADLQSDTLSAIYDGNASSGWYIGSNKNPKLWSNWKAAQNGERTASVSLVFDTAQNVYEVVLYQYIDNYSADMPEEVKFYWSMEAGGVPEEVSGTLLEERDAGNSVKALHYRLSRVVPAVSFTVEETAQSGDKGKRGQKYCVGLTEVELITATEIIGASKSAELTQLSANGADILNGETWSREFYTTETDPLIEAAGENCAVTILPVYEDVIRIFTQSEDQMARESYEVILNIPDYGFVPVDMIEDVIVGSEEGRAECSKWNAVDGNASTMWHSSWGGAADEERYIILKLKQPYVLAGLHQLPRTGNRAGDNNGRIRTYQISVSMDGANWSVLTNGIWDGGEGWKEAWFTETTAQYIRLDGITTDGNSWDNKYMSVAELKLYANFDAVPQLPAEELPAEELPAEELPAEELPAEEQPSEEDVPVMEGVRGENLAPYAYVTESIDATLASDTLAAVTDGACVPAPHTAGGSNPQVWSNYNAAQAGQSEATLSFSFDTAVTMQEIVLYQFTDTWSADLPEAVTFSAVDEYGTEFLLDAVLEGQEVLSDTTTKMSYRLTSPVTTTKFMITERAKQGMRDTGAAYCTGLAEAELYEVK